MNVGKLYCALIIFGGYVLADSRELNSTCLCTSNDTSGTLIYTKASGQSDVLHYLFYNVDVKSSPTILVLKTPPAAYLTVNCTLLSTNASDGSVIVHNGTVDYLYGLQFDKLYEYNDESDGADLQKLSNKTLWNTSDLSEQSWMLSSDLVLHMVSWSVARNSTGLQFQHGGYINISFAVNSEDGHNDQLPHLNFNGNTTQAQITFKNILSHFQNSRYAIGVTKFSTDDIAQNELDSYKSMDDEHTPGVFEVIDWTVHGPSQSTGVYVQWKPVCYTKYPPSIKQSTAVKHYNLTVDWQLPRSPLAQAAQGLGINLTDIVLTNVSFGLSEDGFYRATNYTSWSFTVGYGTPPADHISIGILLIIALGLGLPFILLTVGIFIIIIKNCRRQPQLSGYAPIQ